MARIRTIKPEFWTDEHIVELSPWARLLFIGLWNFADDDGRMVYSPKRIKMQIFPADTLDISELFGELRREKLIIVYVVDAIEYLAIRNFAKHQKIDKRTVSKLPTPQPAPPNPPEFPRTVSTEGIKEGIKEGKGDSEPDGSAAVAAIAPPDLRKSIFDDGLPWLAKASGKPESGLRALLGRWCRDHGDEAVLTKIRTCMRSPPVDPVSWIEREFIGKSNGKRHPEPVGFTEQIARIAAEKAHADQH